MMEWGHPELSVRRQGVLLGLKRARLYYGPAQESAEHLVRMRVSDEHDPRTPFSGSRRMTADLQRQGSGVNRTRVPRLMRPRGLAAIYPRPRLSVRRADHQGSP